MALENPAKHIHGMMTSLGETTEFTWQDIDRLLRVYYCTELQIVIADQAREIEELKDRLWDLSSQF